MTRAGSAAPIGNEQGAVNSGYQRDDIDIVDYQLWQFAGQGARGPAPDLDRPYFTALGAAQVFGRFVPAPFPALVGQRIGLPALNLGMSGAGPSFFLRRPAMIAAANRGRFAIVQLMSGRSVSNHRIVIGFNQGVGRPRLRPETRLRFAEELYQELLAELSPGELAALRAEIRDRYVSEMALLLERITVPTILLYWSQRPVDYQETVTGLGGYWGDFPHFVNREVVDALRPAADDYVEVVTGRGIPQPLFDARTGEPVLMWSEERFPHVRERFHNHYYPSPEMNEDVALALVPVAAKLAYAERGPPMPRAPRRDVLVHVPVFKNASAAIDRSLKEAFRDGWGAIDPPSGGSVLSADDIAGELARLPDLRAVSSHRIRFPLDDRDGVRFHPVVMLRDPITRALAIYDFERMPGRHQSSGAEHTRRANALDFAGWVRWCLELPGCAGPIANFQTRMCATTRNGGAATDWDAWVDIGQYREAAANLASAHVGRVEAIGRSLATIEAALQPVFPELQLLPYADEVGVDEGVRAVRTRESIAAELGPALYARLCEANCWDLLLLDRL